MHRFSNFVSKKQSEKHPSTHDFVRSCASDYSITGFIPQLISGVAVAENDSTTVDVVLHRAIRRPSRRATPASSVKTTEHIQE